MNLRWLCVRNEGRKPEPRRITSTLSLWQAGCFISHRDTSACHGKLPKLLMYLGRHKTYEMIFFFFFDNLVGTMIYKGIRDYFSLIIYYHPSTSMDRGSILCKSEKYLWAWKALDNTESSRRKLLADSHFWSHGVGYGAICALRFKHFTNCHVLKPILGHGIRLGIYLHAYM